MTTPSRADLLGQRLRKIGRDYDDRGYEVLFHVPVDLGNGATSVVDLVATSPDERVLVEVRSSGSKVAEEVELKRLADYAAAHPNTRLELVFVGSWSDNGDPLGTEDAATKRQLLHRRIDEASQLLEVGHPNGALLMVWSAVEGALRVLEEEHGVQRGNIRARNDFASLYSLSLLSRWQFELLEKGYTARSQVAHGYSHETDSALVRELADLASALLIPQRPLVGEMIDWFRDHYEDPAHGVPHDSGEGGYQYFAGGPYFANEVLEAQFPEAHERDIEEATHILEDESFEWVRKGDY